MKGESSKVMVYCENTFERSALRADLKILDTDFHRYTQIILLFTNLKIEKICVHPCPQMEIPILLN